MNVFVVGGGGREHAVVRTFSQSSPAPRLFCAPGNPGIAAIAECLDVAADDVRGLLTAAREVKADLVFVGPEVPLTLGLADALRALGIAVVGPGADGARLEGSKVFSKRLMEKAGIPTAGFAVFTRDQRDEAQRTVDAYVRRRAGVVVKADGLCAGKGVMVCVDAEEAHEAVDDMLRRERFGEAGHTLLLEDMLVGEEVSLLAFTDGRHIVPLAPARDHKRLGDGDRGPNTGGMGAYSPADFATPALQADVRVRVFEPLLGALAAEGIDYRGVIYAGLMLTAEGPRVLEFNARLGDPETQVILPRLKSDFVTLCQAVAAGKLEGMALEWDARAALTVVLAAEGYPESPKKGAVISGLDSPFPEGIVVFHAGTKADAGGRVVTAGGRVLNVTAWGENLDAARMAAYEAVGRISWPGMRFRRDIGLTK